MFHMALFCEFQEDPEPYKGVLKVFRGVPSSFSSVSGHIRKIQMLKGLQ